MPINPYHAAKPTKHIFDAFNSSSTGHQRAENRMSGSKLWTDSRHVKLREQFASHGGGGKRAADTVGAGSDGSIKRGLTAAGQVTWFRANDQPSLQETLKITKDAERPAKRRKIKSTSQPTAAIPSTTPTQTLDTNDNARPASPDSSPSQFLSPIDPNTFISSLTPSPEDTNNTEEEQQSTTAEQPCPQIFANMTVYINGSTAPEISDHRMKHILTKHGARLSISLGRRTVTHVILGRPNSSGGSGGGLAGSKIHKEIVGKKLESVKYVTADWVLESVKADKRLPEGRFQALRMAPKGVESVASLFHARGKPASKK